ncbi:hypothetical protein, partial [Paenibacillus agaridevorans]|uniref:hypothetical protein n=1 Tax=Paenibacillus agaridevorans TaxID=171404 RepID=UPI0015E82A2F
FFILTGDDSSFNIRPLDLTEVVDCSIPFRRPSALNDKLEKSLKDRRLCLNFHHPTNTAKLMLQCVKEGQTERLGKNTSLCREIK